MNRARNSAKKNNINNNGLKSARAFKVASVYCSVTC